MQHANHTQSTSRVTASALTGDTWATPCQGSPAPGGDKPFSGTKPCRSRAAPPWEACFQGAQWLCPLHQGFQEVPRQELFKYTTSGQ